MARDAVTMGIAPVAGDMSAQLRTAVVEGSGQAFVNGLHAAVTVTGILCVLGALAAVIGVRSRAEEARNMRAQSSDATDPAVVVAAH